MLKESSSARWGVALSQLRKYRPFFYGMHVYASQNWHLQRHFYLHQIYRPWQPDSVQGWSSWTEAGKIAFYTRIITGPPTHGVGARLVTFTGVWRRRRLSSSLTRRIYNVTHQGAARDGGPVALRLVRATPCYTSSACYLTPCDAKRCIVLAAAAGSNAVSLKNAKNIMGWIRTWKI